MGSGCAIPTDDIARLCYQNHDCDLYVRRDGENLLDSDHFGKSRHYLLYCKACEDRFLRFNGTPFFNSRLPHDNELAVPEHLAGECGVCQTARLVGVNKDTVTPFALLAGSYAKDTHDELVALPPDTREGPVRCEVGDREQEPIEL